MGTRSRLFDFSLIAAIAGFFFAQTAQAAKLSPTFQHKLPAPADNASVGLVIVSFKTTSG